jgi:hypothetical protein
MQFSSGPVCERVHSEYSQTCSCTVLLRQLVVSLCTILFLAQMAVGQNANEEQPVIDPISVRLTKKSSDKWFTLGTMGSHRKDFGERWRKLGTLYSNAEDPFIQELKFLGRLHYQYGLVDGAVGGNEVNYETDELRRFRLGLSTKLLKYWDLYAEAEVSDDQRPRGGNLDIRFKHMWQFKLHLDVKKAFDLDSVDGFKLGIGSREINMSHEWNTSSKKIKTVERSAIANKIWAYNSEFANPTGIWFIAERESVTWTLGAFSTTQHDWVAPFNDGELYYSNVHWNLQDGVDNEETDLRWTMFVQDVNSGDEVLAGGLDWATAVSIQRKRGPWEFHLEGILGNNGEQDNANREGNFWAIVVMPSYWIVDDALEAVFRYQYQGSNETEGIRLNSRYIRRAGARDGFPSLANGRGDEHHSFYLGLNKLINSHHQKIMAGVEYDSLMQNGNELFGGWSAFAAYRTYW